MKELGRFLMKSGISPVFRIRRSDFSLRFYPSAMSLVMWVDRWHRRASYHVQEDFFRRYLRPGDIVVDVGANIGLYTLISSRAVGSPGKVFAIEPHPRIFSYLAGNVRLNRCTNVVVHNVALGCETGTVSFSDRPRDDENAVVQDNAGIPVPLQTLDDLLSTDTQPTLLKIDVEGYEKFVLEGAKRTLEQTGCVMLESYDRHFVDFGYRTSNLLQILVAHGFRLFAVYDGAVAPVRANHTSPRCENLLALRSLDDFIVRTGFQSLPLL